MFWFIVATATFVAPFYLFWRLVWSSGWRSWWQLSSFWGFELLAVGLPLWLFRVRVQEGEIAEDLLRLGFYAFGLHVQWLLLTLGRDLVWIPMRLCLLRGPGLQSMWLRRTGWMVLALGALFWLVGIYQAHQLPRVKHLVIELRNLPKDLEGFRIVQLSDMHLGEWKDGTHLAQIVDTVNRLAPDLVAITGDFVDGPISRVGAHVTPLERLQAPAFFVTGNHEYYSGGRAWIQFLERMGVVVLENEARLFTKGAGRVLIAGISDPTARRVGFRMGSGLPRRDAAGQDPDVAILLAHRPDVAPQAAAAGFDLQLSGHTHGGQFFPFNLLIRLVQPFPKGLYRIGSMWLYTCSGAGFWGPPMRTFNPPEIALVELRRPDSSR